MSKKVMCICGGIILVLLGVVIGSKNTSGTSEYFEQSKQEFENQIANDEEIKTKSVYPQADNTTKIAQMIDRLIMKVTNTVKNRIGSN